MVHHTIKQQRKATVTHAWQSVSKMYEGYKATLRVRNKAYLVWFIQYRPSFRMTKNDPWNAQVEEHLSTVPTTEISFKYWKIIKTDNLSCQICLCTCTKTSTFRYPRKQMAKENRLISTTGQGTCCWVWSQYSKLNLKNDSISKTVCFSFFFQNWFPSVSNGRKSNKCLGIILTHFILFISTPITKRMVSNRPPEDINFKGSKLSTCTLRPPSARGSHRCQVWERVGCTSHTPASGEPIFATWTRDHQVTLRQPCRWTWATLHM